MSHYYWLVLYVDDGSGNIGSRAFSLPCIPWPLEFCLLIFSLFWVQWVMPQTVAGLLAFWKGRFGRCRNINLVHDITLSFVEHLKVSWEMPDILRIVRILFYIWNFHWSNLYLSGWMLLVLILGAICLRWLIVVLFVLSAGVPLGHNLCKFYILKKKRKKKKKENTSNLQLGHIFF